MPDFWDQIYPKKVPLVICATIGQKSGRFLMAFHCIKFLFRHFDIKLASADFSNNELSKQKHQPNKRPRLHALEKSLVYWITKPWQTVVKLMRTGITLSQVKDYIGLK